MWYITPIIIILIGLWVGRKYLRGLFLKFLEKRRSKIQPINQDFVYEPILASRVFTFSIEIKELGGGKASISVINKKGLTE